MRNTLFCLIALWFPALCAAGTNEPAIPAVSGPARVYVLPIRGPIEPGLLHVIRRGAEEAKAQNATAVFIAMNTPGGRLDVTEEIIGILRDLKCPVYTFVEHDAYSAGAFIALSTDRIYMSPGSVIGAATPLVMSPTGGIQTLPEAIEEKMISAGAAQIRAAAEQGGGDLPPEERKFRAELAEAMVRRSLELRVGDTVISPAGQLLTMTNEEAARVLPGRTLPLLSSGTLPDLPAALQAVGLGEAEVRAIEVSSAERLARLISELAPILLIIGGIGLFIEFRTPGFGLPGMVGILALVLFFWGHMIAGLTGNADILVFALGLLLLLIEIFVIPGFGVVGFTGIGFMLAGLLMAMIYRAPGGPWLPDWTSVQLPLAKLSLSLVGMAVVGSLLGRYLPQSRVFRRLTLEVATDRASGYNASADRSEWLGQRGRAVTDLRPAGVVAFNKGRRVDVVTRGEFLPEGSAVHVAEVRGSRVVVEQEANKS